MTENNNEAALVLLENEKPTIAKIISINAPGLSKQDIETKAAEEIAHFHMLCIQRPDLLKCEPISCLLAVKQVIKKNLSLDPSQGLVYVMIQNVKDKRGNYVQVLDIQETANGKISVARQCGRILDIKRPQILYDEKGATDKIIVEYLVPSYPEPRWEQVTFTKDNFAKWKSYSHAKNSRNKQDATSKDYSNALYRSWKGGIDPEFAATKAIKHALAKMGTNINENAAKRVVIEKIEPVISPEMARKEVVEEVSYVEVKNENTNVDTDDLL